MTNEQIDTLEDQIHDMVFANPKTGMAGHIVGEIRTHSKQNITFDVQDSNRDRWTVAIAVVHTGKVATDD